MVDWSKLCFGLRFLLSLLIDDAFVLRLRRPIILPSGIILTYPLIFIYSLFSLKYLLITLDLTKKTRFISFFHQKRYKKQLFKYIVLLFHLQKKKRMVVSNRFFKVFQNLKSDLDCIFDWNLSCRYDPFNNHKYLAVDLFCDFSMVFYIEIDQMGLLKKMKGILRKTDMFYANDMLRYQREGEYSSLTGGLLSTGIIIAILVGFASMIIETLDRSVITTQSSVTKQIDPTPATLSTNMDAHFMFGIELWRLNITSSKRYFDIHFYFRKQSGGKVVDLREIQLEQCTPEHWVLYPELVKNFQKLEASGWLCPPFNLEVQIQGKYTSTIYSDLVFTIEPCNNNTLPINTCASQVQIDQLFVERNFFYFSLYFLNPVINPGQKEYKSFYLEEQSYVIFGNDTGTESYLYFADYTITTDNSIWPYKSQSIDKGLIVEESMIIRTFPRQSGPYVLFYMDKSLTSLVHNRQVQKLSSVFSFIGGTISALTAALFIVKIYNNLSYELSIALQIFKPEKDSKFQKTSLRMNIFNFIKYYFYIFTKEIGKPLQNTTLKFINECQEEILSQLDIKQLIKRVIFIEHCLNFLFEDHQLQGLQIKKPTSLQQIRKIRLRYEAIECQPGTCLENAGQSEQTSQKSSVISMKIANSFVGGLESPNNLDSPLEPRNHPRKVSIRHKGPDRQIQIIEINDINSQNFSAFNEIDPVIRSKIKLELRREQNLNNLKKDAALGNQTSKKIWDFVERGYGY